MTLEITEEKLYDQVFSQIAKEKASGLKQTTFKFPDGTERYMAWRISGSLEALGYETELFYKTGALPSSLNIKW